MWPSASRDSIREHGPDSVAFYISGQLLTEDYYVFNKLAKGLIGTNNVDTNSRLCMSSAVAGYKATLGADAPPACYEDIDHADCIFIAGSNTAYAHPVLYRRIEDARARHPGLQASSWSTRGAPTPRAGADLHLAIVPGTDVALFNAMLHVILGEELRRSRLHRRAHRGLRGPARSRCAQCTPERAARDLRRAGGGHRHRRALVRHARPATLSLYCQGLNQSRRGTAKNAALINLHLATGQIGRPGAGPFSLTGQPNAMGGREVGGMANLLSGPPRPANPRAPRRGRAPVGRGLRSATARARPRSSCSRRWREGKRARRLDRLHQPGAIDARPAAVRAALERAELVVLQEALPRHRDRAPTPTCCCPPTTWGEKDGTVTNSERRISRVRAAVAAPGEARADWEIALRLRAAPGPRGSVAGRRRACSPTERRRRSFDEHRETHARARPRHHRAELRAAGSARAAAMAVSRGRDPRARAALRRRQVPHAQRPRALRRHARYRADRRASTRDTRCASRPAACATNGTA